MADILSLSTIYRTLNRSNSGKRVCLRFSQSEYELNNQDASSKNGIIRPRTPSPPRRSAQRVAALESHLSDGRSQHSRSSQEASDRKQMSAMDDQRNTIQIFAGHEVDVPVRASSLRFRGSNEPLDGSPRSRKHVSRQKHTDEYDASQSPLIDKEVESDTGMGNPKPRQAGVSGGEENGENHVATEYQSQSHSTNQVIGEHESSAAFRPREEASASSSSHGETPTLIEDNLSSASEESIETQPAPPQISSKGMGDLPVAAVDTTVDKKWMPGNICTQSRRRIHH